MNDITYRVAWADIPDRDAYVNQLKLAAFTATHEYNTNEVNVTALEVMRNRIIEVVNNSNGVDLHEYGYPRMFMAVQCYLEIDEPTWSVRERITMGARQMITTNDWDGLADLVNLAKIIHAFD